MNQRGFSCVRRFGCLAGLLSAVGVAGGQSTADWRVPAAVIRFELNVTRAPSHPSSGLYTELPDGGLLPGPAPVTQVFTSEGTPLDSFTLWHNPARHLALVIASAPVGQVLTVYVAPSPRYRAWVPGSGLTPSAILTTDASVGSIDAARALSSFGRVSPAVHHIDKAGVPRAPLSIAGDETGRPRPASFYMLAHLVSKDPGRTWIAPMSTGDRYEVRVNGTPLSVSKRIDKWGGTGDWAEIAPGANRVEMFVAAPGDQPFAGGGLLYLTWRTPNASMAELGGVRSTNVPMSGTSRMETRIVQAGEIMTSGTVRLQGATAKDGRPVALIRFGQPRVYWFGSETPLLAYRFESFGARPATDVSYTWTFSDGMTVAGPAVEWLLPGFREHQIRLTATSPAGQTSVSLPFYGASTRRTSLEHDTDRSEYRRVMGNMARVYPTGHDSVANWDAAYWMMLLRTVEFGKGTPLLRELFTKHNEVLEARVPVAQLEALQDVFMDVIGRANPNECFDWIRTFSKTADGQRRKDELIIRAAEIYMHYLDDRDSADRLLRNLFRPELDDGQRYLRIRLGDLALLNGDLNLAVRYYAEVQNYTRLRRAAAVRQGAAAAPARGQPTGRPLIGAAMERGTADEWKLRALVDVSASESVRAHLEQGHLLEAREMLRLWERDLPMSKIAADYILLESMLYRAVRDSRRAVSMLYAFCDTIESSNFLPQAAPMVLNLMMDTGQPADKIRDLGERLKKRLEFHPVADHLERLMHLIPKTPEVQVDNVADDE